VIGSPRALARASALGLVLAVLPVTPAARAQSLPTAVEGKADLPMSLTRFQILVAQPSATDPGRITGGVGRVVLILIPKESEEASLGYLESTPGSTGPLWRESGWVAITTAALFVDRPLRHRIAIEFEQPYRIEGPSGSAMLTIALLAALNGHELRDRTTMTGMIMPDGSLGAVGCVTEKLRGAKESRSIDRVVLPASLRSQNIVDLATSLDLSLAFATDVHEAYRELVLDPATGQPAELPRIAPAGSRVAAVAKIDGYLGERALTWLSVARGLKTGWDSGLGSLDPKVQDQTRALASHAATTLAAATEARNRSLNSKAYERALDAVAYYYAVLRYAQGRMQEPEADPSDRLAGRVPDRRIDTAAMQSLRASTETRGRSATMGADASVLFEQHTAVGRYFSHLGLAKRDWSLAAGVERGGPGRPPDPARAEVIRLRAFVHEARALVSAMRAQDLVEMWPRIKEDMKKGPFAPQTLPTVAKLFRVSTAASVALLGVPGSPDGAGGALAAAAAPVGDPEREAIAAAAGELASTDQKDLGNLAAAVELYIRASSVLARAYALAYSEDACTTRAATTALQEALVQKALDLARERAKEALIAAAERTVDAPLGYHNFRYAEELAAGTVEEKLLALEAFWRAGAYARILVLLGPPPSP
jgi:hypothetical protein